MKRYVFGVLAATAPGVCSESSNSAATALGKIRFGLSDTPPNPLPTITKPLPAQVRGDSCCPPRAPQRANLQSVIGGAASIGGVMATSL